MKAYNARSDSKESAMFSNIRNTLVGSSLLVVTILLSCGYAPKPVVPSAETLRELGFTPLTNDKLIPNINFQDLENERTLTLEEFRGSVVLLNFWASWCPPCRAEIPSMENLAEALEDSEFSIIPIDVMEETTLIKAFLKEYKVDFPVYLDPEGVAAQEIGISSLPTSILIDREGRALAVVAGALEWDSEEMIAMMKNWASK